MTTPHPCPQLERAYWHGLDGLWRFTFDDAGRWQRPQDVTFNRTIKVPFAPESPASGIHNQTPHPVLWYSLSVDPALNPLLSAELPKRLVLHFGAVDYEATVWVNGQRVAEHQGGHTPRTPRPSATTTRIPAPWRGCLSTNPGACRICR